MLEKRQYSRFHCNIYGEIYIVGTLCSYPMYIKNISQSGFGLEATVRASKIKDYEGKQAVITFDDNRYECKIIRIDQTESQNSFLGVCFAPDIITDEVFDMLACRYEFTGR
jgi:hypothetical protein